MSEEGPPKTYTRPHFTAEQCVELLSRVWGVARVADLKALPSYDDQNFAVRSETGRRFVLKAFHAEEREETMELQDAVMERLRGAGVTAPFALATVAGKSHHREEGHVCRLLEWVPGEDWCTMSLEAKLAAMRQVGELNGRMDAALRDVRTAGGAERRQWVWRTSDVLLLKHYRWSVAKRQSPERLAVFDALLARFESHVRPQLAAASEGVAHNDLNDHNTLHTEGRISGVIDLGDVCLERHCFSLGNTLFYMMLTLPLQHVLSAAREVAAGYRQHNALPEGEMQLAWEGAKLRCLTSATMSGATQEKHPDDPYVGETEKPGWNLLDYIFPIPSL